jgi:hypothetical protein
MKQLISDPQNWLLLSVIILGIIVSIQGKQIQLLNKKIDSVGQDSVDRDCEMLKSNNSLLQKLTKYLKINLQDDKH